MTIPAGADPVKPGLRFGVQFFPDVKPEEKSAAAYFRESLALAAASEAQLRAVSDSDRALTLANARYSGGLVTYLDVITAQEQLLNNQRLATQILGQRLTTSVLLVKALGGGWDSASLSAIGIKPSLKQAVQQ